ncbi:MAG: hypothetical protein IJ882_07495, partial [Paludibacteraceae bacterium]|nr:hypothetical protein [Paludibacteraceae bacterium]
TLPFSNIAYKKGFTTYHEENEVNFLFTGNITKRFNLGLQMNYLNAAGHYQNQENKLFNGSVLAHIMGTITLFKLHLCGRALVISRTVVLMI